jgi:hypothetical protein
MMSDEFQGEKHSHSDDPRFIIHHSLFIIPIRRPLLVSLTTGH